VASPPVTGSRRELSALLAIAQRDVTKLLCDRPRLAVNLAFPVLLIGGLGAILQPTVGRVTGLSAVTLAFTRVLAASLFQSAAAGMISIVEDRENDFSRELFVTPVSRLTLVGGKVAGETLVALCQGACIVGFALAFGSGCHRLGSRCCWARAWPAACSAARSAWPRSRCCRTSARRCRFSSS
jgi:ABC-2 type transport system permease protein